MAGISKLLRWLFPLAMLHDHKPKLPRYHRPKADEPVYFVCFQYYGDVKYRLEIKGVKNLANVWNHLVKTGLFTNEGVVTKDSPFSLRSFRKTGKLGGLVQITKKYCTLEPKTIKDEFERLRERFCST